MTLSPEHLRCKVGRRATEAPRLGVVHDSNLGKSEVGQESMAILVKNNVVRLKISEDNVTLVEVLKGKQDLSQVQPGAVLGESLVFLEGTAHVTTRGVVQEKEQLLRRLKGVLKANDEWMVSVGEHITLGLGILDKVLTENLLLIQYLHCEVLSGL